MANILLLNTPFVTVGLGTFTFTVPSTINNVLTPNAVYNLSIQSTAPSALPTGYGAGSGQGLGSGAGGGDIAGFSQGGSGPGHGGVGQGFGPVPNAYNQPPLYGSNTTLSPALSSSLLITIKQNGTPVYTSPALTPTQSALQLKRDFLFSAGDAIEVDLTSSNPEDLLLNTLQSTLSIGNGQ
jgi:hypothetical protein